jgi:DnaK suppressor protein
MATKRKAGASRSRTAAPRKKSAARTKPAVAKKSAARAHKAKVQPKAAKAGKAIRAVKAAPVAKAAPGSKPALKVKAVKPVKPPKPAPVVRPIGVLPPEAVARAQKAAPPALRTQRPAPKPVRETAADTEAAGVTAGDFKEFEQRLLSERQKILKEMGHLESTVLKVNQRDSAGDLSGYSFHMADVGTDAMEREKAFLFASNEGQLLKEIDDALRRVYRGEYGVCETCGRPIARARLEAMPTARLCVSCKESEERAGRGAP